MGLRSANVIARIAGGLRIVDPFYGIWTDGKGGGSERARCREAQTNAEAFERKFQTRDIYFYSYEYKSRLLFQLSKGTMRQENPECESKSKLKQFEIRREERIYY